MLLITEEGFEALPEEVRKQIEVIDGRVIFCPSGGTGSSGSYRLAEPHHEVLFLRELYPLNVALRALNV